jgi:hypothetical protein
MIPFRGIKIMFPAIGGQVIGPASLAGILISGVIQLATGHQSMVSNWMMLLSLAGIFYSIQFNPKGTPKSPVSLGR